MTSGSSGSIVDTNILVYAVNSADPVKHQRAGVVVEHLDQRRTGVLSVQCVNEFFWVTTRKIPVPLSVLDARWLAGLFVARWRVLPLTAEVSLAAMDGVHRFQLSWWDALIWAAAKLNGIPTVLSEDGNPGAVLDGVRFLNPFDPAFNVASL